MNTDQWTQILTVLAAVILADRRVYQEEVDVFARGAAALNTKISPEIFMPKSVCFDWFVNNRAVLRKRFSGPEAERETECVINDLKDFHYRQDVLDVMWLIAHADRDYHVSEDSVIVKASRAWGLDLPK